MDQVVFQEGFYSKCELNVLVGMYLDGHEKDYIAEVLCRSAADVEKQIKFKGLYTFRVEQNKEKKLNRESRNAMKLKSIVEKHCGASACVGE